MEQAQNPERMERIKSGARQARAASRRLAATDADARNNAIRAAARILAAREQELLEANAADCEESKDLPSAAYQRLKVDETKLKEIVRGLEAVAALPDPLGKVKLRRLLDEGLELTQVTCPLGVLAIIFESRPDAAPQIGSLAIKSGNAVLLKGGREAQRTNRVLVEALRDGLAEAGLPKDAVQLLEGREDVDALLALDEYVDLVIPRGSSALVRYIQSHTKIPVMGHAEGICHVYVDKEADATTAVQIVRDAKAQYPAVCNAAETLLIHASASNLLPALAESLREAGVELRGCPRARAIVDMNAAADEDWDTEYGELILSVKIVDSLEDAITHIHAHGSGHTEAIVTENSETAERFLKEVDAAGVYHNASTRFADGYRYGFGAEVGISTGKLHARGPVGLEGLLSTKYLLRGHGHRVADYAGKDAKPFLHRDLDF
jgi:glutamate-5-semialdehyde dehydrogenase